MYERQAIHLSIACPFEVAYDYLADPLNYPGWAAVDGATFQHHDGREWSAETEFGPRRIWFCERNAYGVLDHAVYKEGDKPVVMPMRIVPNGEGCELTFLFYRRPGVSDEQFSSAIEWVTTDFLVLKALLEARPR